MSYRFFDTTPVGRIINRFSSDIEVVDMVSWIIIISKSYIAHVSTYLTRYSRRWVYTCTNFQKDRLLKLWIMKPNYGAPEKGLQGATAHLAATFRNTRGSGFFYMLYTTHGTGIFTWVRFEPTTLAILEQCLTNSTTEIAQLLEAVCIWQRLPQRYNRC